MESVEFASIGVERRRYAVEEIRFSMAKLYRAFVVWSSLYGDAHEERERRELVDELTDLFTRCYLPRSMWLARETRERIEGFAEKSRELRTELSADIDGRGYEKARKRMSRRVSRKLGPMRKGVDRALATEISGPKPSRWRGRPRRAQGLT